MSVVILSTAKQPFRNISKRLAVGELMNHFLLAVCSNVSILLHFRDITTFTVYVTVCDFRSPSLT